MSAWFMVSYMRKGGTKSHRLYMEIIQFCNSSVNQFCLDDFLYPAADIVHPLNPQHLVFSF